MSVLSRRLAGIAAIAVAAVVVVLGVSQPSNPLTERHTYYAMFDTVQGLGAIDRDVRIAGVRVGEIGEVERRGDDVRVALTLEEDIPLHRDARVNMRPHTLFEGSNFVDVIPGSPSAPALAEGATIPRAQTSNYVTLDEALRVLRPDIRGDLRTLSRVGARTLRGETVDGLQRTLRGGPDLMRELAPAARALQGTHGRELTGAVQGVSQTVDSLERQSDHLGPLLERSRRTAAALTVDDSRPLDATLAALPGTLHELRASAPALTRIVSRADRLVDEVTPALPALEAAFREGTPTLRRTIPVARQATPLVRDARLIAGRLAGARSSLVDMFQLTEPSLDKFEGLFGIFNKPTALGAPSGVNQLVGGAFSGLNAVFRPFQTRQQNPNAPGHQGRLGVYVNPAGLAGLAEQLGVDGQSAAAAARDARPACDAVAGVSKAAARLIGGLGACR